MEKVSCSLTLFFLHLTELFMSITFYHVLRNGFSILLLVSHRFRASSSWLKKIRVNFKSIIKLFYFIVINV